MRKSAASLVFAFCLAYSGAGEAAYVIKLGNGNEFVTGRYWQEGTQVMFDVYGGVFGIDRAFVTKIEESNKALKLEAAAREDPKVKPQPEQAEEAKESKKPPTPVEAKAEVERNDDAIAKEFITAFKNKISRDSKLFIKYAREFNDAQEIGNVTENALTSRNQ